MLSSNSQAIHFLYSPKVMLTTLIIDDEPHIRDTLARLLARNCPQVNLVGKASGVENGMKAIRELHPELVFLDLNLNDGNAFDMLHMLKTFDFGLVFISTFDRETIRALKLSGLEYLQKPFSPIELVEVIKRTEKHDISNLALQLNALEENLLNLT
jgi:two-component system, LytTR family, response regulator